MVTFKWNNVTDIIKRSGNPGYHVGLPILVGTNSSAMELENMFEIQVEPNGLSVLNRNANNLCINNRPSRKQVFVGVFGNANETNIEDWIEAYHEYPEIIPSNKTCSVITSLKINVIYAAVGTIVNPQFKILGVGYHYEKIQTIDLSCSPCPNLKLSTSVSFFDVTEPAIPIYPKVPSIKANLPRDFFYPFLYGKATKTAFNMNLVIFILMLLFILAT
ncbi:tectonic-3 [Caerostris extrusa]|uniref:Tectonic-3 n=1 Tax=Caerostris extrusa TaxID=172846 RepID=A0AAV4RGN6_CAEEX|nr:tectonic-3 [Caerostris extrusa]